MHIVRNPISFAQKFLRVLDHDLCQLWVVRWLCGGAWFKSYGSWKQCDRVRQCTDGSYFLQYENLSFHETHLSIQGLEYHS